MATVPVCARLDDGFGIPGREILASGRSSPQHGSWPGFRRLDSGFDKDTGPSASESARSTVRCACPLVDFVGLADVEAGAAESELPGFGVSSGLCFTSPPASNGMDDEREAVGLASTVAPFALFARCNSTLGAALQMAPRRAFELPRILRRLRRALLRRMREARSEADTAAGELDERESTGARLGAEGDDDMR